MPRVPRSKKASCPAAASPCCGRQLGQARRAAHDQEVGYNIILRAARAPLTTIASNAGQDGGIVCEQVLEAKGNNGYNAATDAYEDLVKAGIIDPTKVTRTALQNAASVATLLLTSDALIAEKPKEAARRVAPATAATTTCTSRDHEDSVPRWWLVHQFRSSRKKSTSPVSVLGAGEVFLLSRRGECVHRLRRFHR